uniref:Secreted protein n=1 Tax=Oryza nivara TaxID=4536 RepID=A0A0E0H529_ORYNI
MSAGHVTQSLSPFFFSIALLPSCRSLLGAASDGRRGGVATQRRQPGQAGNAAAGLDKEEEEGSDNGARRYESHHRAAMSSSHGPHLFRLGIVATHVVVGH